MSSPLNLAACAALSIVNSVPDDRMSWWLKKYRDSIAADVANGIEVHHTEIERMLCQYRSDLEIGGEEERFPLFVAEKDRPHAPVYAYIDEQGCIVDRPEGKDALPSMAEAFSAAMGCQFKPFNKYVGPLF